MHVISKHALVEFWENHADARNGLAAWHQVASHAGWRSLEDVRRTFPTADSVGRLTVFNIGGNKYRLVARMEYGKQRAYIRSVLTHAEYAKEDWKKDPWF